MQDDKIVVGLDIGTTKICAIVSRVDTYGNLEILGSGVSSSEGVKEGSINNLTKTVSAIRQAVKKAEESSNISINVVNVGISGKHIRCFEQRGSYTRPHHDAIISVEDVERLFDDQLKTVTSPGTDILHVLPQYFSVDYENNVKDPVGMAGVKLEADFQLVTAEINEIKKIRNCLEQAGLEIEGLYLDPLVTGLATLNKEEKEAGVAVIDIGGGTTDIVVYYDGIVRHTAVIPFGGNIITSDIRHGCSVMPSHAETLKVKFGKALAETASDYEYISIPGFRNMETKEISLKNLSYIIEARVEEIFDLILMELENSGFKDKLSCGVVFTGGSALLKDICKLFSYRTGLDARIGYPNEYVGKTQDEIIKNPKYATCLGLVLAGFRSLDDRDEDRLEPQAVEEKQHHQEIPYVPMEEKSSIHIEKEERKGTIFDKILDKTKQFLKDDFDDKSNY
ncbi:cell division protein FtsA [Sediminitomix flava]|uniref:Cell division protein FtsA n=1 Tax=Sediminitomix flava TaxID=379075 RepID=A0A315Z993_SEDFL|nr:cell division protein FtsA [Sediminitomix flava]PWJ42081.1 cell division protein FtsA [Sediminitomix flava]